MHTHLSTSDLAPSSVLILEDEPTIAQALVRLIGAKGYSCGVVGSIAQARNRLESEEYTFLIAGLRLPDGDGAPLIRWALGAGRVRVAAAMTSDASCTRVVEAMRCGAHTVLSKPFSLDEVSEFLTQHEPARNRITHWRDSFAPELLGDSYALREQLGVAVRVAATDYSVLITGETGTGKEVLAHAMHAASERSTGPFVPVNCAALPAELIEAELFGHTQGAFTGADKVRAGRIQSAQGGTLFLDEIGDMPLSAQAKLLRVLQDRKVCPVGSDASHPVDVRVIAATHRSLEEACEQQQFRVDLLYRLNVVTVELPALRDRPEDIVPLARHFLRASAEQTRRPYMTLEPSAEVALREYPWPGNVRELKNAMERSALLATSDRLSAADLRLGSRARGDSGLRPPQHPLAVAGPMISPEPPVVVPPEVRTSDLDLKVALQQKEQELIHVALRKAGGNRTEAAALLGLNRTTLVEKLRRSAG